MIFNLTNDIFYELNQTVIAQYIQNDSTTISYQNVSLKAQTLISIINEYTNPGKTGVVSFIFAVLFILTFIVGIFTNFIVIIVFLFKNELRQYSNYFFANLSIADILVLLVCIPIAVNDLFTPNVWYFGYFYCKFKNINYIFIKFDKFPNIF